MSNSSAPLVDCTAAKKQVKDLVKKHFNKNYSTTKKDAEGSITEFLPNWPEAVKRAERIRQHHLAGRTQTPANPSTEVDQLIRAIDESLPSHRQKLP